MIARFSALITSIGIAAAALAGWSLAGCLLAGCADEAEPTPAPVRTAPPEPDLVERLRALPHVLSVDEPEEPEARSPWLPSGYRWLRVVFDQPVDHDHPEGAHFTQRVLVSHWHSTAPVVLASTGYAMNGVPSDITLHLETNQIEVEHRYFAASKPANDPGYAHLSARQAAADFHAITASLKQVYGARWIGWGISKGGETALFHRFFFPEDTHATVAYGSPLLFSLNDERVMNFLHVVGGDKYAECRARLVELQKAVLIRRDELRPLASGSFTKLDLDIGIEEVATHFDHSFWQVIGPEYGCPRIPTPAAPAKELMAFLQTARSFNDAVGDEGMERLEPFYVQAARELGGNANDLTPFEGLIRHRDALTSRTLPPGIDVTYDGSLMRDVASFVATKGERLMFLYGEYDPWSAAGIDLGAAKDSFRPIVPGGAHGVGIVNLASPERDTTLETVRRWLGLPSPAAPTLSLMQ